MTTTKIPAFVKDPIRFLVSTKERKKVLTENRVRKQQDKAIQQLDASAKKLIVFLVPGADRETGTDKISGGVMSIVSLCEESADMKSIHQAEVVLCTLPNEYILFRHTQFKNHTDVFRFSQLRQYFKKAEEILFHLPEFTCSYFLEYINDSDRKWLQQLGKVHINILNQNIRLMPGADIISKLKKLAGLVTITTAHQRYCNPQYREEYGIPLHKFSVWISPEKYAFTPYREKENLLVVSPDLHPAKQDILDKLLAVPGLTVQVIQALTYEQYKATITRAKWALTFGEGLDGYIIEPIFSGAVGFAVYNEDFFTPDFKGMETIYPSHEELSRLMISDMERLDNEKDFTAYQQTQFTLCAKYYSHEQYQENIRDFYEEKYTFK
jgi:hypothetical protein